jgi:hypothetical protein
MYSFSHTRSGWLETFLFAGAMNINTGMRAKGMPWYLVGDGGGGVGIYDKKTVIL